MSTDIQEAKRFLPLPKLMEQLGLGDHAKKAAKCPFHNDTSPSFSVFQDKDGQQWKWKCFAGCGQGDEIDFLALEKFGGNVKQAFPEYLRMAGVASPKPTGLPGVEGGFGYGEGPISVENTTEFSRAPALYVAPPLALLPEGLQNYVQASAESLNVDPAYVLLPLLSSLSSAIGNTRSILLKSNFTQPPVIWTGIVGRSGGRKSPAIDAGCFAVLKHERELANQNRQAIEMFENDMAVWESGDRKTRGVKPRSPVSLTCLMDDLTLEALADAMQNNPRGVLVKKDELSQWIASFDQYTNAKGSDVSRWLSLHTAVFFGVDRRSDHRRYRIHQPRVSITGGIQPEILKRALTEDFFERGLPARFLFAYPPFRQDRWSEHEISERLQKGVAELFQGLRDLRPETDEHKNEQPVLLTPDPEALEIYKAFYNECGAMSAQGNEREEAAWNKLSGYAARLALVGQLAHDPQSKVVTAPVMRAACDLARWFGAEAARIYSALSESPEQREQRMLIEFIEKRGGPVSVRDVTHGCWTFREQANEAERVLNALVKAGFGEWQDIKPEKGGRPTRKFQLLPSSPSPKLPAMLGETDSYGDGEAPKGQKNEAVEQCETHRLLTDLVGRVKTKIADGTMRSKGQPDDPYCLWDDRYPAEYASALHYLKEPVRYTKALSPEQAEAEILGILADLVSKIDCEKLSGLFPAEFEAAQSHLRALEPEEPSKLVYPGDWLHFRDAPDFTALWGDARALPETCAGLDDSSSRSELEEVIGKLAKDYKGPLPDPDDQEGLDALPMTDLSCDCKLSLEPDGFYYHRTRHVARCEDCQQAEWICDGFVVVDGFPWGDEERIAENDRHAQQELARQEQRVNKAWQPMVDRFGASVVGKLRSRLALETEDSQARLLPQIKEWLVTKAR